MAYMGTCKSGTSGLARRFGPLLPVVLVGLEVLGCGGSRGTVSGQVTYQGKPLPGGLVTFQPAGPNERAITAVLDEEGNYQVVLPVGEVRIAVDNRELEPRSQPDVGLPRDLPPEARKRLAAAKASAPVPKSQASTSGTGSGRYVKIPDKFHDVSKSDLKFTVEPGSHTHDIDLGK
jgi:hypothetical protein